ncbi:multidrug resistance protein fnx1 [Phlyctema vagabunda]|uniref:Multidrug resistance protein fnx1 n=1 Tax=Phlyctema vagabunda TaxID=108571 RepID=A0ABR4PRR6_9HELO
MSTTKLDDGDANSAPTTPETQEEAPKSASPGWKFWVIFLALCVSGLLTALDSTIVTIALLTIVDDLNIGDDYVWIVNVYFLTSAAVQPLYGQLADVFGRRYTMLSVVAIFTLGSGICGGAASEGMLVAGRAIQGIGGGKWSQGWLSDGFVNGTINLLSRFAYQLK